MPGRIPEPWLGFLSDLDRALTEAVEVHCLGGFVLKVLWGLPRPTGDIDIIGVRPLAAREVLLSLAGEGTELAKNCDLHVQYVTIAEYPDGYESRLIDITPAGFRRLKLRALDVHDLVLAKLSRNSPRDRADVEFLVSKGVLVRRLLEDRFEAELRPNLLNEKRETLTFELWLAEFFGNERR